MTPLAKSFLVFAILCLSGAICLDLGAKNIGGTLSGLAAGFMILVFMVGWQPFKRKTREN